MFYEGPTLSQKWASRRTSADDDDLSDLFRSYRRFERSTVFKEKEKRVAGAFVAVRVVYFSLGTRTSHTMHMNTHAKGEFFIYLWSFEQP
jgi:hypothetical protein